MSANAQPTDVSTAAGFLVPPPNRSLITGRDVAFLVYYYPLRWMAQISGDRFLGLLQAPAQWLCRLVQWRDRRTAESKMAVRLGVPPARARQLARQYLNHRVRAALFVLRQWRNGATAVAVRWVGREHLEQAWDRRQGVVLLTVHCLAKREARVAMQQIGRDFRTVTNGPQRDFRGHGRLLWRFTRSRLLPLQGSVTGHPIVRTDPDAVLQIASTLRDGGIVLMSPDILNSSTTVAVQFMNTTRRISTGVLDIARLTGCTVVPMWVFYEDQGCVVEFREPLRLESGKNREEVTGRNLALLIRAMEEQLTAHPEQWEFWDRRGRRR